MTAALAPPAPVTPVPSDHDLLAAVANGEIRALGALFERHEPALRRYLGRLGATPDDVDDLIQTTFLEVVRAAGRFDSTYAVRPWLFGIATMMVRRQRRSLARRAALVAAWTGLSSFPQPAYSTPDDLFEHDELARRVQRALDRLASKKREVFVLVTLEGLSGEEAALVLGVPVKTVWTRLHYARRELRAALGGLL